MPEPRRNSTGRLPKNLFQRLHQNSFSTTTGLLKASWETAIGLDTSAKITLSSALYGEEKITPGDAREDAVALGGIPEIMGSAPTAFAAQIVKEHQKWIERLKTYASENIGVWLFDEHGQVGCLVDDQDNPTTYYPIPIKGMFVGDLATGNYNRNQYNTLMWKFLPNWSDKFVTFLPTDFNPVTDLTNATS